MGYWESHSAAATDVWISPEFAAFYEFETRDGFIPIAAVRERYLPESRKVLEAHYAACWAEGQPYAVQTRLRRSDGSVLDCVVHGEPEFDARGQVRRVSGIVRDVTEETSALRRLAESEQRLADFVSAASDWCWESAPDHRLLPYPKSLPGNAAFQLIGGTRFVDVDAGNQVCRHIGQRIGRAARGCFGGHPAGTSQRHAGDAGWPACASRSAGT